MLRARGLAGACDFDRFFATCSSRTLANHLFRSIAIPYFGGVHELVSLQLVCDHLNSRQFRPIPEEVAETSTQSHPESSSGGSVMSQLQRGLKGAQTGAQSFAKRIRQAGDAAMTDYLVSGTIPGFSRVPRILQRAVSEPKSTFTSPESTGRFEFPDFSKRRSV